MNSRRCRAFLGDCFPAEQARGLPRISAGPALPVLKRPDKESEHLQPEFSRFRRYYLFFFFLPFDLSAFFPHPLQSSVASAAIQADPISVLSRSSDILL